MFHVKQIVKDKTQKKKIRTKFHVEHRVKSGGKKK